MNDQELLNLIAQYERASLGSPVAAGATVSSTVYPSDQALTTLEIDRYNALNAYLARPLGNEIEDRSQVVLPTLRDTIGWMMPQLMRIFAGSKNVCEFDAENEQDEDQAEMETSVVNNVLMQQNNGFLVLHDYFHDALLLRNGYTSVETTERKEATEEKYSGLTQDELTLLMGDTDDDELEVIEQEERTENIALDDGQIVPMQVWDVKLRRKGTKKETRVVCLPPEEMRISPKAREGLEGIPFAQHMTLRARSDLLEDGYPADIVNRLKKGRPEWLEIDALARSQVIDELAIDNPSDHAMDEIEVRKNILRVDYDGDGIAELRNVLVAGDQILENEVIEETPFVSCEGMRMPHRHTGMSIYDLVMDLQIIQTALLRSGLDNLTIANNLRVAVDWTKVNLEDLLTSRPHGPIRGEGPPSQWIQPLEMPSNIVQQVIPVLEYCDQLRSKRTGVGKGMMGLDADELANVTKGGQLAAMSAASLILELIARLLAEGVKGIVLKIQHELIRHQDQPLELQIAGKWTQVNPSEWRHRTRVTPTVGLGSGNREELRANIGMLGAAQEKIAQMGLVGPKQVYETFKLVAESLGFSNPERFAMDPDSEEYKQHQQQVQQMAQSQPQPQVEAAKIRAQTELNKQQSTNQREIAKLNGQLQTERAQALLAHVKDEQQLIHDALQQHRDREVQLDTNQMNILTTLIRAIAPIISQQLKNDEQANAGQVLASDVQTAEGQLQ